MANLLIWQQGKTAGPYTVDEIDGYIAGGQVSAQTPAWTEGLLDWSTVSQVLTTLRDRGASTAVPVFTDVATRAVVPDGVRQFSWVAFAASPVWGVSNRVWLGLLALIPGVGQLLQFWLGFHGRELAWRKGRWESVDQFNQVQKKRAKVSMLIWFVMVVCGSWLLVVGGARHAGQAAQPQPTQDATKKTLSLPLARQAFERIFKGHSIGEVRAVLGAPVYEQTDKKVTIYGYKNVTLQPDFDNTDDGTLLIFSGGQLKAFKYVQEEK